MNPTEYDGRDGLGLAELIRSKQVSATEVLDAALARMDAVNGALNAVIHRMDQSARVAAASPLADGPFAGVPFLVKDLVQLIKGEPYRAGSRFLDGFIADHETELMLRWRRAGLIPIGRTNTPEFGLAPFTEPELFGPTKNPWKLSHTPGGSSGGSAAAVAAGIVPIASGGDGGGSIRVPSSCCGLFGLKPTRGRLPTGPDLGQIWFGAVVDHVLTRSVRDSAAVLDATHGPDVGAPYQVERPAGRYLDQVSAEPGRRTIAWTAKSLLGGPVHPDCVEAVHHTVRLLERLGHQMVEIAPVIDGSAFAKAFVTMICSEVCSDVQTAGQVVGRVPERAGFEATTWALHLLGRALRADELSLALRYFDTVGRSMGRFFESYDALVTPTMAVPPFPIGALQPKPSERFALEMLGRMGSGKAIRAAGLLDQLADQIFSAIPFTPMFNTTGQPAMSVPLHWNQEGLPIGTQLVGRFGDEATLFQLAGQLERAQPWFHRRPPVR